MSAPPNPDRVPVTAPEADAPPRPAASVVLVRDGAQGLEVLLLRRHQNTRVLGGLYVFPGGKLDPEDSATGTPNWLDADPGTLRQQLAEDETDAAMAQGLFVAGLRETFEEVGVLLCEPRPDGQTPPPSAPLWAPLHTHLNARLQAGQGWPQALDEAGWRWHTQALRPWSRWITPANPLVGTPRFDTRFFLARLPAGQTAVADEREATEAVWLAPREALARAWAGEMGLIAPQLLGLAQLARHATADSAWVEAAGRRPPCIRPAFFKDGEHHAMCYPGDPLHPEPERALPGPTRLRIVGRRFEPFDGFDGWFR